MSRPNNLEAHHLANLFPMMEGAEFEAFRDDIKVNGLIEPIWIYEGKILDGRNRYRACQEADVEVGPMFNFDPETHGDPATWVISKNLKRRHLNESQRGMVMARLATLRKGANQHAEISAPSQAQAAKMLNVSVDTGQFARKVLDKGAPELVAAVDRGNLAVSAAAKAASMPIETQIEIAAKANAGDENAARTVIKQKAREEKERALAIKQMALPEKRYGAIVADPEWDFGVWSEAGKDRAAENHYPTSSLSEIMARDVAKIAADDCVLFLWTTVPMLSQALEVMKAWGFEYKTNFVWGKNRAGTGYWNRNTHEQLLVGVRGNIPAPAPGTQRHSLIMQPVTEHSAKPELFLQIIEEYFPNLAKIELNCRGEPRAGWDAWGNEVVDPSTEATTPPTAPETKPVTTGEMPDLPAFLDRRPSALVWVEEPHDDGVFCAKAGSYSNYYIYPRDDGLGYDLEHRDGERVEPRSEIGDRLGLNEAKKLAQSDYNKRMQASAREGAAA
jgi:N6-adenosine-specific RNA methylase IME4